MTNDEIIRMARDAISDTINQHDQMLKRLWCIAYEAGQNAEREACAKSVYDSTDWAHEERDMVLKEAIAAAIRARGDL